MAAKRNVRRSVSTRLGMLGSAAPILAPMLLLAGCGDGSSSSDMSSSSSSSSSSSTSGGSTSGGSSSGGSTTTASVNCPYTETGPTINLTSTTTGASSASWSCSSTTRSLTGNGIPNHAIGTFPNTNNPNSPTAQSVSFSATLTPVAASSNQTGRSLAYSLNSVKFDPGTGGGCPSTATSAADCSAVGGGTWTLEALGQTFYSFGTDSNNAHVQPEGTYHYHGMPEGQLTAAGVSSSSPKMVLVGWAPDGYPVYARYGYTTATDAKSAVKTIKSSYALKSTPDSGRPSTSNIPMGAFTQDYEYKSGSGDLDDCNGRTGVTPEFPSGIYHYFITDTFPFAPRCWKGTIQ